MKSWSYLPFRLVPSVHIVPCWFMLQSEGLEACWKTKTLSICGFMKTPKIITRLVKKRQQLAVLCPQLPAVRRGWRPHRAETKFQGNLSFPFPIRCSPSFVTHTRLPQGMATSTVSVWRVHGVSEYKKSDEQGQELSGTRLRAAAEMQHWLLRAPSSATRQLLVPFWPPAVPKFPLKTPR